MLGLRHELADRHVFDHAPAQRADGLVGHGGAPVLSEVVEHLDLRTGRFHRLRLLIITRAAQQAPYRERQYLLLNAAAKIHSGPSIFNRPNAFPAAEAIDIPLSDEAVRFYKSGMPFKQAQIR